MWSLKKKFSPLCRFYGMHDETVAHVSECPKPAQKEYSPNNMASYPLETMWKVGISEHTKWYMHKPKQTLKSEECKILWDFPIKRGKQLEHNRPDITMTDKKKKHASLLTHHAPLTLVLKRKKKSKNYCDWKFEIKHI